MRINWFNRTFDFILFKIKSVNLWKEDFLKSLLNKKNITDKMNGDEQNDQQKQGFPCPECDTITPITMEVLIYNQPIFCSGCGIKFMLNTSESHEVIEELKKVHKAQQELKDVKGVKTN